MSLKARYRSKWKSSNRRELLVLRALEIYLPATYKPVLSGLGAGSSELVNRSYNGLSEAFDITVLRNDTPVAYIDVTGVESLRRARSSCNGLCVGEWKLEKCSPYNVCNRTWIAFVTDEDPRIRWMPIPRLESMINKRTASRCRLYRDERTVYCSYPSSWLSMRNFLVWLSLQASSHRTGGEILG